MDTHDIKKMPQKSSNTLVLGGGGVTGIAWMTGLLKGLEQRGLKLAEFDRLIGTSAGSTLAAQLSSGATMDDLYRRQVEEKKQVREIAPSLNRFKLLIKLIPALLVKSNPIKFRQRIGEMALKTKTVSAEERRQVILDRMPKHEWPEIQMDIMAVHSASGEIVNFSKYSKVDFVDAVAASCAVPGVWPSVLINGEYYYDGGIRSGENADFALEATNVFIISPLGLDGMPLFGGDLKAEIELLKRSGSEVVLIYPDSSSKKEMGKNPLDPSKREASAKAGYQQGLAYTKF
ncbi:MAG: patatin-like phospholipase family protein [Cellvibrionaceae bacterium]